MDEKRESEIAVGRIVHTPAKTASAGISFITQIARHRDRLVPMGLAGLDDYFGPALPGDLVSVIAKSHNGKSLFMRDWAHRLTNHLKDRGRNELVVWVDTETSIDHLAISRIAGESGLSVPKIVYDGGYDLAELLDAAKVVGGGSMTYIAAKLGDDNEGEITLTNIKNALRMMTNGSYDGTEHRIAAIFIDYLQALPFDPAVKRQQNMDTQRRLQVSNDVDTCRRMASMFECPVILGVQAKQDDEWMLNTKTSKEEYAQGIQGKIAVAGFWGGQETANIGQRSDRLIGLGMPKMQYPKETRLLYKGHYFDVDDSLMFVQVHKQRLEGLASGDAFVYSIDHNAPAGSKFRFLYGG